MQSISLKTHVGADGMLCLELPLAVRNADLEVMVILAEAPANDTPSAVADNDAHSLLELAGMFESGKSDTSAKVRPIVTEFLLQKHAAHSTP